MRNWNMLYEPQPLHLDALLLAAALVLHLPLVLIHMKAAPKSMKAKPFSRLTNIDFIEEQIKKRKEKTFVLPPKLPQAPKKLEEMVKKVEEVKQQIFQQPLPPPPPKPKVQETLVKGPEITKLDENRLKNKLEQDKKILQGKGSFQGKDLKLSGPEPPHELKIAGGGAALQAGSRLTGPSETTAPKLEGKSGFRVSKETLPLSIGGGDEGALKMGGANIVVVPMGARTKTDASILSPVADKKDRGPLLTQGPAGLPAAPSPPGPRGLAGAGGAGKISTGGNARTAVSAPPVPAKEEKKLESKQLPNPLAEAARSPANSVPGLAAPLPRRIVPKVQRPLFLITGPLADRKVASREIPAYPDWAREKGVEASVVLQFTVTPEGNVKDNILVLRTSGYPPLDDLAVQSLKQWKFVPLAPDQYREEIGTITFNFSVL